MSPLSGGVIKALSHQERAGRKRTRHAGARAFPSLLKKKTWPPGGPGSRNFSPALEKKLGAELQDPRAVGRANLQEIPRSEAAGV